MPRPKTIMFAILEIQSALEVKPFDQRCTPGELRSSCRRRSFSFENKDLCQSSVEHETFGKQGHIMCISCIDIIKAIFRFAKIDILRPSLIKFEIKGDS